jgi:hypothetical protein
MNVDIKSSRVLGQTRPANTSAASAYKPSSGILGVVTGVIICNQSATESTYRLFLDVDGTTYDETTAIAYDAGLAAYQSEFIEFPLPGLPIYGKDAGNFAVRAGTSSAMTFTILGYEVR